jgi:hypothetical protein
MKEKRLTIRVFAAKIGRSSGYVSDVLNGHRGPTDDVRSWATALGLAGKERAGFILTAGLARSPRVVVQHIRKQEQVIADMRAKLEASKGQ